MTPIYALVDKNGEYINVDNASGGYFYLSNIPRIWTSEDEALKYAKLWPEENWYLMELRARVANQKPNK